MLRQSLLFARQYHRHAPFVDRIKALVASGRGGDGSNAFEHEMNNEFAGPGGGNGGKGGAVILRSTSNVSDLSHIQALGKTILAGSGIHGKRRTAHGKGGADLILEMPIGTQVTDVDTNEVLYDFCEAGVEVVLLEGGLGGKGNNMFKSALSQTPLYATKGMPGNTVLAQFELKLIADCGLVGYPNAGKSSLLGAMTTARPQVAPYPFTTLHPFVGRLFNPLGEEECSIADLPGLIEGAYENRGLGHQFLRHVERTHALLYVVDMAESYTPPDRKEPQPPWEVVETLASELEYYEAGLSERAVGIVCNKMDVEYDSRGQSTADKYKEMCRRFSNGKVASSLKCFPVSSKMAIETGDVRASGITALTEFLFRAVVAKQRAQKMERSTQRALERRELEQAFDTRERGVLGDDQEAAEKPFEVVYQDIATKDDDRYGPARRPPAASSQSAANAPSSRPHSVPPPTGRTLKREGLLFTRNAVAPHVPTSSYREVPAAPTQAGPSRRVAEPQRSVGRRDDRAARGPKGKAEMDELRPEYWTAMTSLVDQQLMGDHNDGGRSGYGEPFESYFSLPREGAVPLTRDLTTQGSYWRLTRQKGDVLPVERESWLPTDG